MKRFHVHVAVDDLQQNIRFYSGLFGLPPAVEKSDYAKWMLEDPRINFAISTHGDRTGVNHLGLIAGMASLSSDERLSVSAMLRQKVPDLNPQEVETAVRNNIRWYRKWRQQRGLPISQAEIDKLLSDDGDDFGIM